jgi:hypothetical protein
VEGTGLVKRNLSGSAGLRDEGAGGGATNALTMIVSFDICELRSFAVKEATKKSSGCPCVAVSGPHDCSCVRGTKAIERWIENLLSGRGMVESDEAIVVKLRSFETI